MPALSLKGRVTASPFAWLFWGLGFCLLLSLALWQLQRMEWKAERKATIAARMIAAPTLPPEAAPKNPQDFEFTRARVSGIFLHDKEIYLAAREEKTGEIGYQVITPLQRFDEGGLLLVSRGWVPLNKKDPKARASGNRPEPATITGILRPLPTQAPNAFVPDNRPDLNHWYWLDPAAIEKHYGIGPLYPLILEADDTPNTGGWPKGGQARIDLPDNHRIYAATWFFLAAAWLYVFLTRYWQKENGQNP